jgi:hypothetical protein
MPHYMMHAYGIPLEIGTERRYSREELDEAFRNIWEKYSGDTRPWPGLPPQKTKEELKDWLMDLDGQG